MRLHDADNCRYQRTVPIRRRMQPSLLGSDLHPPRDFQGPGHRRVTHTKMKSCANIWPQVSIIAKSLELKRKYCTIKCRDSQKSHSMRSAMTDIEAAQTLFLDLAWRLH